MSRHIFGQRDLPIATKRLDSWESAFPPAECRTRGDVALQYKKSPVHTKRDNTHFISMHPSVSKRYKKVSSLEVINERQRYESIFMENDENMRHIYPCNYLHFFAEIYQNGCARCYGWRTRSGSANMLPLLHVSGRAQRILRNISTSDRLGRGAI